MKAIFLEAESFDDLGGWLIDQQSVLQMGSPYLMAHGLGIPVADATTTFDAEDGEYTVWVRTRDWTAPWGDLKAGKFELKIDGETLPQTLGVNSNEWGWQKAGRITLSSGKHSLALHDLTGFNGRCDAIYLTADNDIPPNDRDVLCEFRKSFVSPDADIDTTVYDLIVVGGGIAGICTALSSARCGNKVLLVHDREILGGCNSSEVRVCLGGKIGLPPYRNLGRIVREIQPIMGAPHLFSEKFYEDDRKKFVFMMSECNAKCTLALGESMINVTLDGKRITEIETLNIKSGKRKKYKGKLFSDCTGDATLSRMAGAEVMYGREAKSTFGESLGAENYEKLVMGHSIRWYSEECNTPVEFPSFDTGMFKCDDDCLHVMNGDWEQETGFRRDMAEETEYIRDYGLYVIFGNWSFQKNQSDKKQIYANRRLVWASHLGGKRESYRVVGDHIMTQNDIEDRIIYDDATASMSWSIDIHFPEATNEEKFGEAFRSFAYHRGIVQAYPVPYRCLYARDVDNLFLGGRTVSTSHVAFSSVRVMRTLGMLGEAVGLASAICRKYSCTPREVYRDHLEEYKEMLCAGVPSPSAFQCEIGDEEAYHFKDAGWFYHWTANKIDESPYKDKVRKNIEKIAVSHKYEGFKKL